VPAWRGRLSRALALAIGTGIAFIGAAAPALGTPAAGPSRFVPGPCPKPQTPIPALENADCGFLAVPEDRAEPDGRTIRLAVAIVPSESKNPRPDPVVYLTGGPGGSAIGAMQNVVNAGATRDRDLIVMDQRGTLYSQPSLTCPMIDRYNSRVVGLRYDAPSTGRAQTEATRKCRRSVVSKGADPADYNTTESAADFADLRQALGIEQWNVIGASYGTDLALTYMREHPAGIRSVTIDSVLPPSLATVGHAWTSAGQGMSRMFRACAIQPRCHSHYSPRRDLGRIVRQLENHPITRYVKPALIPGDKPAPGAKKVKVVLDGGAFANYMINITGAGLGADVPALLHQFAQGHRHAVLASQAGTGGLHAGELSYGLQYGVVCSEWVPYAPEDNVGRKGRLAFPKFPRSVLAQAPQFPFRYEDCPVWNVPKAPVAQRQVTRSDIPTLVLAGSFDSLTSADSAQYAARTLPNSTYAEIPGAGHVVLNTSRCAGRVFVSFLRNPSGPDTSCVAALRVPPFHIGSFGAEQ
jgi:pimeloyl-ACP methyl ester carboxylesterase